VLKNHCRLGKNPNYSNSSSQELSGRSSRWNSWQATARSAQVRKF